MWLPILIFILAALISFSTGSSWGTMAILYPLSLPLTWELAMTNGYEYQEAIQLLLPVISVVLSGSVLGDHCSPISDTTILSSLASQCNHIDHVKTQLPYALVVGGISCLLLFLAGFGLPFYINFPLGITLCFIILKVFGKSIDEKLTA
jgi:Na+/H+ antiporter NhaC